MVKLVRINLYFRQYWKLPPFLFAALIASLTFIADAHATEPKSILLKADRIFDGHSFKSDIAITVKNGVIENIDPGDSQPPSNVKVVDLGDATILPGFIELHAHLSFQKVPEDTVLKHGITTIRDLGGPVHKPYGGNGRLRVLTSGPIITAPGGYPIPILDATNIAIAVSNEKEARNAVRKLILGGAVVIKVALEPGGEAGAPWSSSHGHHRHDQPKIDHGNSHRRPGHNDFHMPQKWPLLPEMIVKAIVDEAHKNNRKVTAHVAEEKGVQIAINSGVDEWAHMPCEVIPVSLLKLAKDNNVRIVSTLDTLSKCPGVAHNSAAWKSLGGELLYGAEIAHPDIPWGIDAQELLYFMIVARMSFVDTLRAATSKAGLHLNLPLLGTLKRGAPADIIAVKGDPSQNLKLLEYPDLVISGGEIIVNNF